MRSHALRMLEQRCGLVDLIDKLLYDDRKFDGVLVRLMDVIHHDRSCRRVNVIANIVKCNGKSVDVLAVKWRDERPVQFGRYAMGDLVALMLYMLDPFRQGLELTI